MKYSVALYIERFYCIHQNGLAQCKSQEISIVIGNLERDGEISGTRNELGENASNSSRHEVIAKTWFMTKNKTFMGMEKRTRINRKKIYPSSDNVTLDLNYAS